MCIFVYFNNFIGYFWRFGDLIIKVIVIDESFCDIVLECFFMVLVLDGDCVIFKSFGKFWGFVGLCFGFMIVCFDLVVKMCDYIGFWVVFGFVFIVGIKVFSDSDWVRIICVCLVVDVDCFDYLIIVKGVCFVGGCFFFCFYEVENVEII